MVRRNKMYLKRRNVQTLALRIVYDLATRVPEVLLHRVEDCDPSAKEKVAKLMEERRLSTLQQEQVTESVNSADANDKICHEEPVEVMVKQEIVDDWCCINENVTAVKMEMKEEMTFEEHGINIDENLIRKDDTSISSDVAPITNSCDQDSLRAENAVEARLVREESDVAAKLVREESDEVRCEIPMETSENSITSDNLQDNYPVFDIIKIKIDEDDDAAMRRRTRYSNRRFMSFTPEKSPVRSHKNYMVKFPSNVVKSFMRRRRSKKKECRMCKKKFDDKLKLEEHMSIHAGTFKCMVCGEVFQCHGALKGHIRLHLGERSYHCKGCLVSKSKCNASQIIREPDS